MLLAEETYAVLFLFKCFAVTRDIFAEFLKVHLLVQCQGYYYTPTVDGHIIGAIATT